MRKYLPFLLTILTLPLVVVATMMANRLFTRAQYKSANIVIDTRNIEGKIDQTWSSFAQGGEEPPPMLKAAVPKIRELSPRYIRLDHIFDSYGIVGRNDNNYVYDFTKLDETVEDIIASGALPFFSLSYMPIAFTNSGSVIDIPSDWNNWKDLVRATIEHYSGSSNKNLSSVYYEVWNEPELPQFGGWKLTPEKDYRLLYLHASKGSEEAQNVNNFYFGGPSVGSYYPNWITDFLSYIEQNNLRLDFYSWHRYTKKPGEYEIDSKRIREKLSAFPAHASVPLILSEWGLESANDPINSSNIAAAFAVSAITSFHNDLNLAAAFEILDGPPPTGGKWGLLTHEKDSSALSPKPRFKAFVALNNISGDKVKVSGAGTFVNVLASKSDSSINVILSNYDSENQNSENVPVTFTGLSPASYILKYNYPLEGSSGSYELITTTGHIEKKFIMLPNTILELELTFGAQLASFIPGRSGNSTDGAILLNNDSPIIFHAPEFQLRSSGKISFDLKPFWGSDDNRSFFIFDAPYATTSVIKRLFLAKQRIQNENILTFGISAVREEIVLQLPISNWQKDTWHYIELGWDNSGIWGSVDGNAVVKKESTLDIRNGKMLSFYPIEAAVDNLRISLGGSQTIERLYDGDINK